MAKKKSSKGSLRKVAKKVATAAKKVATPAPKADPPAPPKIVEVVEAPKGPPLRYGIWDSPHVRNLQRRLKAQGYFIGQPLGNFKDLTQEAVILFQQGHIDQDGRPLEVDGIVGRKTWWAIYNPSADPQRSFLKGNAPSDLPEAREAVLKLALAMHKKGIREDPDGSNDGDGVTDIHRGKTPGPWCARFVSHVFKEATGDFLLEKHWGLVIGLWRAAKPPGFAHRIESRYEPRPGDIFTMLYRNSRGDFKGTGHTGFVLRYSRKAKAFNTLEGNAGNRLKLGTRKLSQSTLVGFISPYRDGCPVINSPLITAQKSNGTDAGNTR